MKRYTYLHRQTRYMEWVVIANSEEEADALLFDDDHSYLNDDWSKHDEVELRTVEELSEEEYKKEMESLS